MIGRLQVLLLSRVMVEPVAALPVASRMLTVRQLYAASSGQIAACGEGMTQTEVIVLIVCIAAVVVAVIVLIITVSQ
ncbi:hypothetical protein AHF37_11935 [Paragonimus kellicotti]|nr:hypothetical protein AHF37_11935 [Paragonimus kellicotti]